MENANILIVDDNKNALLAMRMFLQLEFTNIDCISNPKLIPQKLKESDIDIVLLDMNYSPGDNNGSEGLFWIEKIKNISPNTEIVTITAYGDVELAVKALKLGATDFVLKPWENEKLLATLLSCFRHRKSNKKINDLKNREASLKKEINKDESIIIGESKLIQDIKTMISKVAKTDANILITGENGTGKELVAREIHKQSMRSEELLVSVDMGAIHENLFESELFGHKKGAFTDAKADRLGKFELANNGSLFLDEIGNLPMPLQSKLLAALQNREISLVGGNAKIKIDIRLISATNSDIQNLITENKFREDLLYRLNTINIELPPLRERTGDIEILANHFLKIFEKKYAKNNLSLNSRAISKLNKYNWPGNIRELRHTIEKAVILCESDIIMAEDFNFSNNGKTISNKVEKLEDMEKQMIEEAIKQHKGNLSNASKQLGVSRQTLYNKINKYGL
ncbi:MAG: sigma-54 dependent transcriptional regulator [Marinifilaceae bacterium]|jgi:DNA-binding NtrC family response regulator|nr:sigma-54 dependent transcriptional regulator [Marinifilaceae bacterium]